MPSSNLRGVAPSRRDPAAARAAYEQGWAVLRAWVDRLPEPALARPSVLPGWTVSDLVAHLVLVADSVTAATPAAPGTRGLAVGAYLATYPAGAGAIADRTREAAGGPSRTLADLQAALDERAAAALAALDALGPGDPVVAARRGPARLGVFLATRAVELAVHADDLARSLPEHPAPQLPRATVRTAVRALLDALAERAPGRSVEVRVPPYAAVQCIPGPRHTRGTPPGVVETDAATWLRVAAGRTPWAQAGDAVRASGERTDLSAYLPLL